MGVGRLVNGELLSKRSVRQEIRLRTAADVQNAPGAQACRNQLVCSSRALLCQERFQQSTTPRRSFQVGSFYHETCAPAFLIGYSPELLYKAGLVRGQTANWKESESFLKFASPSLMAGNWYWLLRCVPTYFDADPWSRSPNSVHYIYHQAEVESLPTALDTVGILAAIVVIAHLGRAAVLSYRRKELEKLCLTSLPFLVTAVMVLSSRAGASYYQIRRYMLPAGIVLTMWIGVWIMTHRIRLRTFLLAAVLALSAFHQWQLLRLPDELADWKRVLEDVEQHGYKHGAAGYLVALTLSGLSDERVVFAVSHPWYVDPYGEKVREQNELVVVEFVGNRIWFEASQRLVFGKVVSPAPKLQPPAEEFRLQSQLYRRIGEVRQFGELAWASYRRAANSSLKIDVR
jgi:hypothetical protein